MPAMQIPTIALHGALGTAAQFDALLALPDAPPLTPINFPGHAGVPCDVPFSNAVFADAVFDQMEKMGAAQTDLFGYSMGGYVALWMAWKYPEKIRKVVTLNTKLDWTPETAARMTGMFDTEKITAKAPQMAEAFARAHAPGDWLEVAQKTARFLLELGNGAAIPEEGFSAITCPVTILRGDNDSVVTEGECRQVAGWIPSCSYAEVPNSKHPMELVDIQALTAIINQ